MIDATQSVGALPFDIRETPVDTLACAGYKWLTGPYGIGLAYFGTTWDEGVPLEENWITRRDSENLTDLVHYHDEYQPGAIRYDMGERSSFLLLPMLEAALSQVLEWGVDVIQAHCRTISNGAIQGLETLGYRVVPESDRAAHLFGVRLADGIETATLQAALAYGQVSVSLRGDAIRVSPHLYNDIDDFEALIEAASRAAG